MRGIKVWLDAENRIKYEQCDITDNELCNWLHCEIISVYIAHTATMKELKLFVTCDVRDHRKTVYAKNLRGLCERIFIAEATAEDVNELIRTYKHDGAICECLFVDSCQYTYGYF